MTKQIQVWHGRHKKPLDADFILLPIGVLVNQNIECFEKGDKIFITDSTELEVLYVRRAYIADCTDLLALRYNSISIERIVELWEGNHGKGTISKNECLVVWYKTDSVCSK